MALLAHERLEHTLQSAVNHVVYLGSGVRLEAYRGPLQGLSIVESGVEQLLVHLQVVVHLPVRLGLVLQVELLQLTVKAHLAGPDLELQLLFHLLLQVRVRVLQMSDLCAERGHESLPLRICSLRFVPALAGLLFGGLLLL